MLGLYIFVLNGDALEKVRWDLEPATLKVAGSIKLVSYFVYITESISSGSHNKDFMILTPLL